MAKLNWREMNAVVETVMGKIREASVKSPEQLDYEKKKEDLNALRTELKVKSREVVIQLGKEYQEKYPDLKFEYQEYQNYSSVLTPKDLKEPKGLSKEDIERELIIANISGNIQETMDKVVTKYTNK